MRRFLEQRAERHVLRVWNYLGAINQGVNIAVQPFDVTPQCHARLRAVCHEGARSIPGLNQPFFLQILIDGADRHRRDASLFGQLAHRGKLCADNVHPEGYPIFDRTFDLLAHRNERIPVDIEVHAIAPNN